MDVALLLFAHDLRVRGSPALAGACARRARCCRCSLPTRRWPYRRRRRASSPVGRHAQGRAAPAGRRPGRPARRPDRRAVRLATPVKAETVFVAGDVSRIATRRAERLRAGMRQAPDGAGDPGHAVVPRRSSAGGSDGSRSSRRPGAPGRPAHSGRRARHPRPSPSIRASSRVSCLPQEGLPPASRRQGAGEPGTGP